MLTALLLGLTLLGDVKVEDPARYHEQGLQYMEDEKWNLAVEQLQKSIEVRNDDWRVWIDLGDALVVDPRGVRYGSKDRNEKARQAYNRAADLNPASARAWNNLAWLAAKTGLHLDEALTAATRAVEIDSTQAGYLDTLAEVHFARGEVASAAETIERARVLEPDDAYLARQLRRFQKALAEGNATPIPTATPKAILKKPKKPVKKPPR